MKRLPFLQGESAVFDIRPSIIWNQDSGLKEPDQQ